MVDTSFVYSKAMALADTDLYRPKLSAYKFVIPFETPLLDEDGTMYFPACAVAVAESESQALLLLLRFCQKEGLVRERDWEWLFYCDVEVLPAGKPTVTVFITL